MEKKYSLPKTLVLDYEVWRCGDKSKNEQIAHGLGETKLLNAEGYMCCLGQFALQAGLTREYILELENPSELEEKVEGLTQEHQIRKGETSIEDSMISYQAMRINDDTDTTIAYKVVLLCRLLKAHSYELELKNFPEEILQKLEDQSEV